MAHPVSQSMGVTTPSLCHGMFCQKVASSQFHIKPKVLPPTSATAKYHLFRVFHKVKLWMGETLVRLNGDGGSRITEMQLTKTDLGCAPSELLSLIRLN